MFKPFSSFGDDDFLLISIKWPDLQIEGVLDLFGSGEDPDRVQTGIRHFRRFEGQFRRNLSNRLARFHIVPVAFRDFIPFSFYPHDARLMSVRSTLP